MPFCDIAEDVSLHYITNSLTGDVADFNYAKPTILLLPPIFCDVSWLREQFRDSRLSLHYNLIGFDQRNIGRTRAPLSPKRDTYVDAADLAIAHELLQLPSCHVFACSMVACGAALRFAFLFPQKCLSLCLLSAANQVGEDPDWVPQGYRDLRQAWCFPRDMDELERGGLEFSWFMFNNQVTTALEDEMVAWWQVNLPATKRTNFLATGQCGLQRSRLSDKELNSIRQPTLFVQGDRSLNNPPHKTQKLAEKIPNSRLFVVKGGPEFMNIIPEYAPIVHRAYCQFLSGLPASPFFEPSQPNPEAVAKAGLQRLAVFADDSSIATRDLTTTLSFCILTTEQIQENAKLFEEYTAGEQEAFTALGKDGRPIRKFSERMIDQWTPSAFARFDRMKQRPAEGIGGIVAVVESSSSVETTTSE